MSTSSSSLATLPSQRQRWIVVLVIPVLAIAAIVLVIALGPSNRDSGAFTAHPTTAPAAIGGQPTGPALQRQAGGAARAGIGPVH